MLNFKWQRRLKSISRRRKNFNFSRWRTLIEILLKRRKYGERNGIPKKGNSKLGKDQYFLLNSKC